jgi:hypothetical protein
MKPELDLAELLGCELVTQNFADARKNRAENELIAETDLGENDSYDRAPLIPAHHVSFASGRLERREDIEQNSAIPYGRQSAPRVHEEKNEGALSTLAAFAFQRDHAVEGFLAEDLVVGGYPILGSKPLIARLRFARCRVHGTHLLASYAGRTATAWQRTNSIGTGKVGLGGIRPSRYQPSAEGEGVRLNLPHPDCSGNSSIFDRRRYNC